MPLITNQNDAQRRRKRIQFCYLCGLDLGGQLCTTEHVVPKTVLGAPGRTSPWPVVLNVHQQCEQENKRANDALFALWYKLWLPPAEVQVAAEQSWEDLLNTLQAELDKKPQAGPAVRNAAMHLAAEVASLDIEDVKCALFEYVNVVCDACFLPSTQRAKLISRVAALVDRRQLLASGHYRQSALTMLDMVRTGGEIRLGGLEQVFDAVWTWIRGLHAFCYSESVPYKVPHAVFCDLPIFRGDSTPQDAGLGQHHEEIRGRILAQPDDALDGVRFWNDACSYRCAWIVRPSQNLRRCVWYLVIPGNGEATEYTGWYDVQEVPSDFSVLT